jgi:hypothetical protein
VHLGGRGWSKTANTSASAKTRSRFSTHAVHVQHWRADHICVTAALLGGVAVIAMLIPARGRSESIRWQHCARNELSIPSITHQHSPQNPHRFFPNHTNGVGGSFILSLQDSAPPLLSRIPPTKLVDRSYSAYCLPRLNSRMLAPCRSSRSKTSLGPFSFTTTSAFAHTAGRLSSVINPEWLPSLRRWLICAKQMTFI